MDTVWHGLNFKDESRDSSQSCGFIRCCGILVVSPYLALEDGWEAFTLGRRESDGA